MPVLPSGQLVLETLADYRGLTLTAFCLPCDRSQVLDHDTLAARFSWDVLVADIRRRLRCQQCGRRPERLLVGYHQAAVPDG